MTDEKMSLRGALWDGLSRGQGALRRSACRSRVSKTVPTPEDAPGIFRIVAIGLPSAGGSNKAGIVLVSAGCDLSPCSRSPAGSCRR